MIELCFKDGQRHSACSVPRRDANTVLGGKDSYTTYPMEQYSTVVIECRFAKEVHKKMLNGGVEIAGSSS